jgi:hypothetical protein
MGSYNFQCKLRSQRRCNRQAWLLIRSIRSNQTTLATPKNLEQAQREDEAELATTEPNDVAPFPSELKVLSRVSRGQTQLD